MIIINFSHPLCDHHLERVEQLCEDKVVRVLASPAHFDQSLSFVDQAVRLVDQVGLTAVEWQTERLLVVPPSLAAIACLVVAEIHGRAGYFPPLIRISPQAGKVPPVYEVCEILDLAGVRERARLTRQ